LEPIYYLPISIVGDFGEIYIDSCALVAPGGTWLWDDGHGNVNPTFNNDNGTHTIVYTYLCGDANRDGLVNVSDAVRLKNYIFVGGAAPNPLEAGDVNCDGNVNVSDAVWIMNYIFLGGNAPCDTNGDGVPDC
jgi:hypothetical protein